MAAAVRQAMGTADPAPVRDRRQRANAAANACPADAKLQSQQSARSAPGPAGSGLTDDPGHLARIGPGKQRQCLGALFDHQRREACAIRFAPPTPCRAAPCGDQACWARAQTVAARGRRSRSTRRRRKTGRLFSQTEQVGADRPDLRIRQDRVRHALRLIQTLIRRGQELAQRIAIGLDALRDGFERWRRRAQRWGVGLIGKPAVPPLELVCSREPTTFAPRL